MRAAASPFAAPGSSVRRLPYGCDERKNLRPVSIRTTNLRGATLLKLESEHPMKSIILTIAGVLTLTLAACQNGGSSDGRSTPGGPVGTGAGGAGGTSPGGTGAGTGGTTGGSR